MKTLRQAFSGLAYVLLTAVLTMLGVAAWFINTMSQWKAKPNQEPTVRTMRSKTPRRQKTAR